MVPNQKHIDSINKAPCDTYNIYMKVNINALQNAMNTLTGAQFKVWLYFAKNQDKYEFELSSVAVQAFCDISDKTYRDAIKVLVEKRYLVPRGEKSNHYDFYEVPLKIEVPAEGSKITCHTSTVAVSG